MKKQEISNQAVFGASGCLSKEGLDLYARQLLKGDILSGVEEHVRSCPLCAGAADGLKEFYLDQSDHHKDSESFKENEERSITGITAALNEKIEKHVREQKHAARYKKKLLSVPEYWIGIAAGVLLLFGIYLVSRSPMHLPQLSGKYTPAFPDPAFQSSGDTLTISVPPGTQLALNFQSFPGTYFDTMQGIVILPKGGIMPLVVEPAAYIPVEGNSLLADSSRGVSPERIVGGISKAEPEGIKQAPYSNPDLYSIEQIPQFPGGDSALAAFLAGKLMIPADSPGHGTVYVSFLVNSDGSLSEIKLVKGLDEASNKEAIRAVSLMPRWLPARQNGKPVKAIYNLPVNFSRH